MGLFPLFINQQSPGLGGIFQRLRLRVVAADRQFRRRRTGDNLFGLRRGGLGSAIFSGQERRAVRTLVIDQLRIGRVDVIGLERLLDGADGAGARRLR